MERVLELVKSDGILGFRLGDTTEEVFSRIRNLELLSEEEIKEKTQAFKSEKMYNSVVVVGQNMFEDVSSIFLSLSSKGLNSIIVNIKHLLSVTPEQQLRQLSNCLSLIVGKTPTNVMYNMFAWSLSKHKIVLSYGTSFDVTDEICLSFD